jgi:hypothetical protein
MIHPVLKPCLTNFRHSCRDEIAGCSEKAYDSLSLAEAKKMMLLKTDQEVRDFAGMVSVLSIELKCIFNFLLALLLHRTGASLGQNAANICSCSRFSDGQLDVGLLCRCL